MSCWSHTDREEPWLTYALLNEVSKMSQFDDRQGMCDMNVGGVWKYQALDHTFNVMNSTHLSSSDNSTEIRKIEKYQSSDRYE